MQTPFTALGQDSVRLKAQAVFQIQELFPQLLGADANPSGFGEQNGAILCCH